MLLPAPWSSSSSLSSFDGRRIQGALEFPIGRERWLGYRQQRRRSRWIEGNVVQREFDIICRIRIMPCAFGTAMHVIFISACISLWGYWWHDGDYCRMMIMYASISVARGWRWTQCRKMCKSDPLKRRKPGHYSTLYHGNIFLLDIVTQILWKRSKDFPKIFQDY